MPAGHGGWRSSLVLLPRCLWSRSRFDGPLWGRWPRIGWYLWVSDPGSAGMGHRCSSSGVGRHDDMSCRLSQVSLLFYCNIFFQICLSVLRVRNGCIRTYTCSCRRFSSGIEYPRVGFSPSAAYMRQCTWLSLVQVVACRLFGAKPLPEPMLLICQSDPWEQVSVKLEFECYPFHTEYAFDNVVYLGGLFVWASMC